jgi:hypothetical protein
MQGSNYNLLRGLITEFQNFSDPIEMDIPIPKRYCFIETVYLLHPDWAETTENVVTSFPNDAPLIVQ